MTYVSPADLFTGRTVVAPILIALGLNASFSSRSLAARER